MTLRTIYYHQDNDEKKVSLLSSDEVGNIVVGVDISKLVKSSATSDCDCTRYLQTSLVEMKASTALSMIEKQKLSTNEVSQVNINNKCQGSSFETSIVDSFRLGKNALLSKTFNEFNINTADLGDSIHPKHPRAGSSSNDEPSVIAAASQNRDLSGNQRAYSFFNERSLRLDQRSDSPDISLRDTIDQSLQIKSQLQTHVSSKQVHDEIPQTTGIYVDSRPPTESNSSDQNTSLNVSDNEAMCSGSKRCYTPLELLPTSKKSKTTIDAPDCSQNQVLVGAQQSQVSIKFHEDYYNDVNQFHDEIDNLIDEIETIDDILVLSDDDGDIDDECDAESEGSSSIGCLYFNDYDVSTALTASSSRRILQSHFPKRDYTIRFTDCVNVVEIPHRNTYSVEEHELMWTGTEQLQKNAERNSVEYEYERWNMESVVEENEFVVAGDGQLIHPVHSLPNVDCTPTVDIHNNDIANENTNSDES